MITINQAKKAIAAGEEEAKKLGVSVSIAITDEYGDLIAFSRMDGALKVSPKFAQVKANTSAMLGMVTQDLEPYVVQGKPYYGINLLFGGEFTTIAGGVPIKLNNKLSGGIGVGGSFDVSQDAQCAQAALKALED